MKPRGRKLLAYRHVYMPHYSLQVGRSFPAEITSPALRLELRRRPRDWVERTMRRYDLRDPARWMPWWLA